MSQQVYCPPPPTWRLCHPVNIYVFQNGQPADKPVLCHIPMEKKKNMQTVLEEIGNRMKLTVGYPVALYHMDGTRVCKSYELEMYNNYVVVTNLEKRFKCANYGEWREPLVVIGSRYSKHVNTLKMQNKRFDLFCRGKMRRRPLHVLMARSGDKDGWGPEEIAVKGAQGGKGCGQLCRKITPRRDRMAQCCSDEIMCVEGAAMDEDQCRDLEETRCMRAPPATRVEETCREEERGVTQERRGMGGFPMADVCGPLGGLAQENLKDLMVRYKEVGSDIFKLFQDKIGRDIGGEEGMRRGVSDRWKLDGATGNNRGEMTRVNEELTRLLQESCQRSFDKSGKFVGSSGCRLDLGQEGMVREMSERWKLEAGSNLSLETQQKVRDELIRLVEQSCQFSFDKSGNFVGSSGCRVGGVEMGGEGRRGSKDVIKRGSQEEGTRKRGSKELKKNKSGEAEGMGEAKGNEERVKSKEETEVRGVNEVEEDGEYEEWVGEGREEETNKKVSGMHNEIEEIVQNLRRSLVMSKSGSLGSGKMPKGMSGRGSESGKKLDALLEQIEAGEVEETEFEEELGSGEEEEFVRELKNVISGHSQKSGGKLSQKSEEIKSQKSGGNLSQKSGGNLSQKSGGNISQKSGGSQNQNTSGRGPKMGNEWEEEENEVSVFTALIDKQRNPFREGKLGVEPLAGKLHQSRLDKLFAENPFRKFWFHEEQVETEENDDNKLKNIQPPDEFSLPMVAPPPPAQQNSSELFSPKGSKTEWWGELKQKSNPEVFLHRINELVHRYDNTKATSPPPPPPPEEEVSRNSKLFTIGPSPRQSKKSVACGQSKMRIPAERRTVCAGGGEVDVEEVTVERIKEKETGWPKKSCEGGTQTRPQKLECLPSEDEKPAGIWQGYQEEIRLEDEEEDVNGGDDERRVKYRKRRQKKSGRRHQHKRKEKWLNPVYNSAQEEIEEDCQEETPQDEKMFQWPFIQQQQYQFAPFHSSQQLFQTAQGPWFIQTQAGAQQSLPLITPYGVTTPILNKPAGSQGGGGVSLFTLASSPLLRSNQSQPIMLPAPPPAQQKYLPLIASQQQVPRLVRVIQTGATAPNSVVAAKVLQLPYILPTNGQQLNNQQQLQQFTFKQQQ